MTDTSAGQALPVRRRVVSYLFRSFFGFGVLCLSIVAFERTTGAEADSQSKPGVEPSPTETAAAASPSPSQSPAEPVAEATPAPTAVLSPSPIDTKLVGNWELSDSRVNASENVRWEIRANGNYKLQAGSDIKTGILSTTSDSKIRLNVEFTGVVEVDYKISDNILTTTAPDGTVIDWRLVQSAPKPHKIVHKHHGLIHHHPSPTWFDRVKRFFGLGG
jgi:hypothetical protein